MTASFFYTRLLAVTALAATLVVALQTLVPEVQEHWKFSVACTLLFIAICVVLYYAGYNTAQSSSKLAFNGIISVSVLGKMLLALVLLFVYQKAMHPTNKWFVAVFLSNYVVFTVFEVWFMSKLGRMSGEG